MQTVRVTAEQLQRAAVDAGIVSVDHHECSICGVMVRYYIETGELCFDSSCGCSYSDHPRPCSWREAAEWVNMQTNEDIARQIMTRFGLSVGE